jgi:hypothetical protein
MIVLYLVTNSNVPCALFLLMVALALILILPWTYAPIRGKPWLKVTLSAIVRLIGPAHSLATVLWEPAVLLREHIIGRVFHAGHASVMAFCGWCAFMLQV